MLKLLKVLLHKEGHQVKGIVTYGCYPLHLRNSNPSLDKAIEEHERKNAEHWGRRAEFERDQKRRMAAIRKQNAPAKLRRVV